MKCDSVTSGAPDKGETALGLIRDPSPHPLGWRVTSLCPSRGFPLCSGRKRGSGGVSLLSPGMAFGGHNERRPQGEEGSSLGYCHARASQHTPAQHPSATPVPAAGTTLGQGAPPSRHTGRVAWGDSLGAVRTQGCPHLQVQACPPL